MKTGGLPHLVYIIRKPEPFGIELKCVAGTATGCMLSMEVQEGKNLMKNKAYNKTLGATTGCSFPLMELSCDMCKHEKKQECYVGDSWLTSVETTLELASPGVNFVGQVKQCYKNFPWKYLEKEMECYKPGNWIIMQLIVPMILFEVLEYKPYTLVKVPVIGYEYCYSKILCFVMNQNARSVFPGPKYKI